ncbi:MAG: LPS export ABC transporter periplasmic protein LptC [Candidatus Hydrogenedentes bacterium]|nr:LPS export ABC transporter periplasmic protein LptC [Candidatus Hydrogenedentota bacterium]
MRKVILGVLVSLLLVSACSKPVQEERAAPILEDNTGALVSRAAPIVEPMQMKGINLYMHRPASADTATGKPELWISADSFSVQEEQIYSFEKAHAVIYSKDDQEITLDAAQGIFEQDKSARLEGEVRMVAGSLKIMLHDIEWSREEGTQGTAKTDRSVIIDDPDLQLNAAGMRLYPDERVFELTDVSGVVRFGKELT